MLQKLSLELLDIYQNYIRIILPPLCRFSPHCSEYTKQAIIKYGFLKGILLGLLRLLQCHPLSTRAGYDPLI